MKRQKQNRHALTKQGLRKIKNTDPKVIIRPRCQRKKNTVTANLLRKSYELVYNVVVARRNYIGYRKC